MVSSGIDSILGFPGFTAQETSGDRIRRRLSKVLVPTLEYRAPTPLARIELGGCSQSHITITLSGSLPSKVILWSGGWAVFLSSSYSIFNATTVLCMQVHHLYHNYAQHSLQRCAATDKIDIFDANKL